jgi:N-acetyl-anhydromuramyl-L-alanine amidase AmpD
MALMQKIISLFIIIFCSKLVFAKTDSIPAIHIIEKPISYSEERKKLSVEYLQNRHGLNITKPIITPKIIVLHFTDGGTIKSVFNYFNNTTIEAGRSYNKKQSNLNVSSHYLIDRDGTIYHLLSDTLFARHTIGLNYCAIGVENIGSVSNPLTEKQVTANIALIKHLSQQYPIEYVIGHSEYGKFRKTPLWKETDASYFTGKTDPGDSFLKQVREGIKNLKVKSSY